MEQVCNMTILYQFMYLMKHTLIDWKFDGEVQKQKDIFFKR